MAHDEDSPDTSPGIRRLLTLSIPALGIGIGSAVTLKLLDVLADWLQDVLWETLPAQFGADRATSWWIFLVLTLIGVAVGAVVWLMPGHGSRTRRRQSCRDRSPHSGRCRRSRSWWCSGSPAA